MDWRLHWWSSWLAISIMVNWKWTTYNALLYEVRPETGFVLALDAGSEFLRGAVSDLSGAVRAHATQRAAATTGH